MAENPIARIKKLDEERSALLAGAKTEALERATQAVADLNLLGFSYSLVQSGKAAAPRKAARKPSSGPCPICKYQTDPPHDGRKHRAQAKKKPFTPAELAEYGLKKI